MAFGFFRRRQKLVLVIMAVLMVTFLVGANTLDFLFKPSHSNDPAGTTRIGALTASDMQQARNDLIILNRTPLAGAEERIARYTQYSRLPAEYRAMLGEPTPPLSTDADFVRLYRTGENKVNAYALLLQEAGNRGIKATSQDVDVFLSQMGLGGDAYNRFLAEVKSEKISKDMVRKAIADWLMITRSAASARYDVPPSQTELQHLYRDLRETLDARVVTIPADDLKAGVLDPSKTEIEEQFNRYSKVLPNTYSSWSSLGFGYARPNQAQVSYLFVSRNVLERAAQPTEQDIRAYFKDHLNDEIDAPAPNKPAVASTTSATSRTATTASAPAEEPARRVRIEALGYTKASPLIADVLRPSVAAARMDDLMARIEKIQSELPRATQDVYSAIVEKLKRPATEYLGKTIANPITNVTVEQAMKDLAAQAGLQSIAYPWGSHEGNKLDPALKVTISAPTTLAGALDEVGRQLKWYYKDDRSRLSWSLCDGMGEVLFPFVAGSDDVDMFPVSAHDTDWISMEQFNDDPVLGRAYGSPSSASRNRSGNDSMFVRVYTASRFGKRGTAQMNDGDFGANMYVEGATPGRLMWRLVATRLQQPMNVTDLDADTEEGKNLKAQVRDDCKIVKAMAAAETKAKALADRAAVVGLDQAAREAGLVCAVTKPFARRDARNADWSDIPGLKLLPDKFADSPQTAMVLQDARKHAIEKAFELAPDNVEPATGPTTGPATAPASGPTTRSYPPSKVIFFQVPTMREIVVMQRNGDFGFEPAVQSDYERFRPYLARQLMSVRGIATMDAWYDYNNIKSRLSYQEP